MVQKLVPMPTIVTTQGKATENNPDHVRLSASESTLGNNAIKTESAIQDEILLTLKHIRALLEYAYEIKFSDHDKEVG